MICVMPDSVTSRQRRALRLGWQFLQPYRKQMLLALLALVTLLIKTVAEWKHEQQIKAAVNLPPERPTPLKAS